LVTVQPKKARQESAGLALRHQGRVRRDFDPTAAVMRWWGFGLTIPAGEKSLANCRVFDAASNMSCPSLPHHRRLALGVIAALSVAIPTEASFVGPVDLGSAGSDNWTILALGGTNPNASRTNVSIANESIVEGNVGVAEAGNIAMSGNSTITGTLYLNTAGSLNRLRHGRSRRDCPGCRGRHEAE
jgi:hypothetical protein